MSSLRIAIMAHNSPSEYSGGRYYVCMMAEALAEAGHQVTYITNNRPVFYDDFSSYPSHDKIDLCLTRDFFWDLPPGGFDILFLVPRRDRNPDFFLKAQLLAQLRGTRLASLSFETPNWFNELAPRAHDLELWKHWKLCCRKADLVLSFTAEGVKYARKYFNHEEDQARHTFCYPPINSIVADAIGDLPREKRIVLFARFGNTEHKGTNQFHELFCEQMRGYTLGMVTGGVRATDEIMGAIEERARCYGVKIELLQRLTDEEKFRYIKRSRLLLFPSFFEGFGLPPVEAQYCNVPCIAFDLPVLREVNGDGIAYVKPGNWGAFRQIIGQVLSSGRSHDHLREGIAHVARFEAYVERMNRVALDLVSARGLVTV